jgi:hypothetical protein
MGTWPSFVYTAPVRSVCNYCAFLCFATQPNGPHQVNVERPRIVSPNKKTKLNSMV